MLSILLILYINHINVCSSSIIFGFQTSDKSICCDRSTSTVTLTLHWHAFKYQCDVNPIKSNTYYSCHTSNISTTSQCISNPSDPIQYGLRIDANHPNTVQIDRIIVKNVKDGTITDIPYDIDYFCFNLNEFSEYKMGDHCNQNEWDIIPISNDQISPYKIFQFLSKNESYVHDVATATDCILCSNRMNTAYYGGVGGVRHSVINQGPIKGISSWGITPDGTLSNIQWIFDESQATTSSNIIEHDPSTLDIICEPFILDTNDHIIGYNVIYSEFVFGLVFYTLQNKSYECIDTMYNDSIDENSGIILYKDYYLNGFYSYWEDVTYSIAFQFTPFDDSDLCSYKYIAVESSTSWQDGNSFCKQQYNTTLAIIITESDFQIANYIKNNIYTKEKINLWIGLTYNLDKAQWRWIDGTSCEYTWSGECVDDQYWGLNEPDIGDSDNDRRCSVLSADYDGYYQNVDCSEKYMFLCNNPHFDELIITPSTDSTKYPTVSPSKLDLVNDKVNDDGKMLELNGQIVIGIGIILGCCTIPLLCGMIICCYMYYHENMIKINMEIKIKRKMMEIEKNNDVTTRTKQTEYNEEMEALHTLKKTDHPQMAQNKNSDKGQSNHDDIDKKKISKLPNLSKPSLSDQDSLKQEQLTNVYTVAASGVTGYNPIKLDDDNNDVSFSKTNEMMNIVSIIGGYSHKGLVLDVIDSKEEYVLNETLKEILSIPSIAPKSNYNTKQDLEIVDSAHEYALNGSLHTIMNVPSIPTVNGEKYRKIEIIDSQKEYEYNESLKAIFNVPSIPNTNRYDTYRYSAYSEDIYVD